MNLTELLAPRSEDQPSGENLEYDSDFTALERAAQPKQERQAGDEILAAEEPNHKDVIEKAMAVLARSHDLRAAVHLASAELRENGLSGFADATSYIRGCLQDHWDTCHPQLDADDDNDPTARINAVVGLAGADTVLRGIRFAPLSESPTFGRFNLRDIAIAEGEIQAGEDEEQVPDLAAVNAAFKDTKTDILQERLAAAQRILEDLGAINDVFADKTPGNGPNIDPAIRMMSKITQRLGDALGNPEPEADAPAETGAEAAAPGPRPSGGPSGAINSPADVRAALDRIIGYYRQSEPSSPLPILLERARRLVGADFMTIVKDIAPNGLDNVMNVGGIEETDN
ncbi:MAG: type VI secretion system protein TssA [Rhodobacteraceae bacterium]|nr:type VI secretion system protein TssA [Paracoccaceae bacterium]